MQLTYRRAAEADWPGIARLLRDSALPLEGAYDHLESFIVAERERDIIGCAAIERYSGVGLLRSVAVDRSSRSARIGEGLVNRILAMAREDRVRVVALLTTTAETWFPRFGFQRVDRAALSSELAASAEFRGACPATAIAMIVELR